MPPKIAHSAKTLETLRLLDCDVKGWRLPDIKYEKMMMNLPVKEMCPTCYGKGQVADDARRKSAEARFTAGERVPHDERYAMQQCPTCPPRKGRFRGFGTGEVTVWKDIEVEVGIIQWPKGTIFGSRFDRSRQCELCGKRPIVWWVAVLGYDSQGRPHGLWVGDDCARTILGVSRMNINFERAASDAAQVKVWREIPKAPRPKKPEKPKIAEKQPTRDDLDAIVAATFPTAQSGSSSYWQSRAELSYRTFVRLRNGMAYGWSVKLSARHGVTVKNDFEKVIFRNKESQDIAAVLREALPTMEKDLDEAKGKPPYNRP